MIPESFDCKLCKKRFPTKAILHTHLSYSQLHRQHLLDLRRKYTCAYEEVDRVDQVLKKTVEQFYSLLTMQRLRKQAMRVHRKDEIRLRWKQAIQKVVHQCTAKKYAILLQEMQEQAQQAELRERGTFQPPPFLFFEDSKFFWRSKTRFALQYFVHEHLQCIEVVPQLLPILYSDDDMHDGLGRKEGIFGKRVYLDLAVVLQAAKEMAQRVSPAGVRGIWETTAAMSMPGTLARSDSNESSLDEQSVHSQAMGGASSGEGEALSLVGGYGSANRPSALTNSLHDRSLARLVAAYISSKLRLDHQALANGLKTPEQALYFDDRSSTSSHVLSPVLPQIPPSVVPVSLERTRWYSAEEMCVKLEEVRSLQQELHVAVCKAEMLAKRLEEKQNEESAHYVPCSSKALSSPRGKKGRRGEVLPGQGASSLPPLDPRSGLRPRHGARLAGVAL